MPNSNKPLYIQVESDIKNSILLKEYGEGQKLPTEDEFSKKYNVSKITIRKALDLLAKEHLIEKIQGKGSYVSYHKTRLSLNKRGGFSNAFLRQGSQVNHKILQVSFLKANSHIAENLNLSTGDEILFIERLICESDAPVGIDCVYLSSKDYPDFISKLDSTKSLFDILRSSYSVTFNKTTLQIEGIRATEQLAETLECDVNEPLFRLEKINLDDNGKPIHYSISIVRCDRVSYIITSEKENISFESELKIE